MKAPRPVGFLNVDLEIESSSKLSTLLREMGDSVYALYSGPGKNGSLLVLENSSWPKSPDAAIRAFCAVVERISARGRRLWDGATSKIFDVGYEVRAGTRASHITLKPETLERIVALGATLAFTCYPEDNSEQADCTEPGDDTLVPGRRPLSPGR